jgi:hypothetical protein
VLGLRGETLFETTKHALHRMRGAMEAPQTPARLPTFANKNLLSPSDFSATMYAWAAKFASRFCLRNGCDEGPGDAFKCKYCGCSIDTVYNNNHVRSGNKLIVSPKRTSSNQTLCQSARWGFCSWWHAEAQKHLRSSLTTDDSSAAHAFVPSP